MTEDPRPSRPSTPTGIGAAVAAESEGRAAAGGGVGGGAGLLLRLMGDDGLGDALPPKVARLTEHPERPDRAKCAYLRLEKMRLLEDAVAVGVGLYPIVSFQYRSTTLYQVAYHIR